MTSVYAEHPDKPFYISTDFTTFDKEKLYQWLSVQSYWAKGRTLELIEKAFSNSLAFGLFHDNGEQLGAGRYVTDRATMAYLADVFIDPASQGQGLGHWFIGETLKHPDLQGLMRMMLATVDQHSLYEKFGFTLIENKNKVLMEKLGALSF